MEALPVFVSVGTTANTEQEEFVRAVEERLRSEGLIPYTVGRNTFTSDVPLKAVTELLDKASGTVVIALERSFFQNGVERRGGPRQVNLESVKLPTPWNHIEAAMAYARGQPLLVIVKSELKSEGLLENGYDWYVQRLEPTRSALSTLEFNGVLASWKTKVEARAKGALVAPSPKPTADLTMGELVSGLRPSQLWGMSAAIAALIGGAFALGAKLH